MHVIEADIVAALGGRRVRPDRAQDRVRAGVDHRLDVANAAREKLRAYGIAPPGHRPGRSWCRSAPRCAGCPAPTAAAPTPRSRVSSGPPPASRSTAATPATSRSSISRRFRRLPSASRRPRGCVPTQYRSRASYKGCPGDTRRSGREVRRLRYPRSRVLRRGAGVRGEQGEGQAGGIDCGATGAPGVHGEADAGTASDSREFGRCAARPPRAGPQSVRR